MSSTVRKMILNSPINACRTSEDRKAYKNMMKKESPDYWNTPEGRSALAKIDAENRTAAAIRKYWRGPI